MKLTRFTLVIAALAVAVLEGCGGSAPAPAPTVSGPDRREPAPGTYGLRRDLVATVLENYAQLGLGNARALADRIAHDRPVTLLGVGPEDVAVGVEPSGMFRDRRLLSGRRARILSKNLDVHLSRDRSIGWVFDEVSYRIPVNGREASIPVRITGVYARDVDRWVLVVQHQSYALAPADLVDLARAGDMIPPADLGSSTGKAGPAGELRRLVERVLVGPVEEDFREQKMAASDDALVLFPGPFQEYAGERVREVPTLGGALAAELAGQAELSLGDSRVEVSRSGTSAWMSANLRVAVTTDAGPVELGLRGTFLFEDRPRYGWELIQTHISAPIPDDVLGRRAFGTEGPLPE